MKRIIKTVAAAILLLVFAFILFTLVIYPAAWRGLARRESIRLLEEAQTTNEFALSVGSLGIFLPFEDHSWMAIRYRDSHAGQVSSSSIVRDSGGSWFESSHHFCGMFTGYAHTRTRQNEMQKLGDSIGYTNDIDILSGSGDMHRLASSPNLQVARSNLVAIGFQKINK